MEKKQEKLSEIDNAKNMDICEQRHQVLEQIRGSLEKEDYKTAFRLFRNSIIKILCREGILQICSPYYYRNGRIKEDKVAGELIGVYEYYYSGNSGFRSFQPHGKSFRCGKPTVTFIQEVKGFLQLLYENNGQDPWEILCDYMGSDYFDLENYIDKAGVYGFAHNRRSREVTRKALAPYAGKYYGSMDADEFIEYYEALDRAYTTYGFPFACTYAGWFFEGYDVLYRKILDEGIWTLRNLWEHGPSDWLIMQMEQYPDIELSYEGLIKALQKSQYEPLLFRIFPFRLTEDTLRPGCGMDSDEWEEFALKLAETLNYVEKYNGKKNVPNDMVLGAAAAMGKVLNTVRYYIDI